MSQLQIHGVSPCNHDTLDLRINPYAHYRCFIWDLACQLLCGLQEFRHGHRLTGCVCVDVPIAV